MYDDDKQLADAERIPQCALHYLLAAHRLGCDAAWDKLCRGFAFLAFEEAERLTKKRAYRLELLAVMFADLGRVLLAARKSRLPADKLEAHLRRELSNAPKHAKANKFTGILDSRHCKNAGRMRPGERDIHCPGGQHHPAYDDAVVDEYRRDRLGNWRKPRGIEMHLTSSDDRERQRHKAGWYLTYCERAEDALRFLALTPDEFEIMRFASAGDSPEEICRMSRFNSEYVNGVLASIPARLRAHTAEKERYERIRHHSRG